MATKVPNPIDVHVGRRLRMRRMLVGMSQEKLGESLDVTFQQVQKYERGANRISASRLFDISHILDVPVQYFFDDIKPARRKKKTQRRKHVDTAQVISFLSTQDGAVLIRTFSEIDSAQIRRNIIDLVKSISEYGAR